ncbi:kinase-like domain-containing protein [Mycena sanguinolenta]|nr:kinase-like domain-containing protein [Mycena sanguinolenta]
MSCSGSSSEPALAPTLPLKALLAVVQDVYLQCLSQIRNQIQLSNVASTDTTSAKTRTTWEHLCSPTAPCIAAHALLAPLLALRLVDSTWDAAVRSLGVRSRSLSGYDEHDSRGGGLNHANLNHTNANFFAPVEEGTYYPHAWHVDTRVRKVVLLGRYRVFKTISSEEGKRGVYLAYDLGGPEGCLSLPSMPDPEVVIKAWVDPADFECVREVGAYGAFGGSDSNDTGKFNPCASKFNSCTGKLNPCRGVPQPHIASAQHDKLCDVHALVLPKLGPSLEDLRARLLLPGETGGTFDLRMVLWVAIQMLDAYQSIHARGVIHNGAKPANICLSPRSSSADTSMLYAIDFGFSIILPNMNSNSEVGLNSEGSSPLLLPSAHRVDAVGNRRFMSVFAHHGIGQSQRDDLESLAYLLSYLFHGTLPWDSDRPAAPRRPPSHPNANASAAASKLNNPNVSAAASRSYSRTPYPATTAQTHIWRIKLTTPAALLFRGMPACFAEFWRDVKALAFAEVPDYETMRGRFVGCLGELDARDGEGNGIEVEEGMGRRVRGWWDVWDVLSRP